jgi:WD40 repeat protein
MTSSYCFRVLLFLAAVVACTKAKDGAGKPVPGKPVPPAPPPSQHGDVTARDGVYRVGEPRFKVADEAAGGLVVHAKQGMVVAQQGSRVLVWDARTGIVVHDLGPVDGDYLSVAVSYDVSSIAVGNSAKVRLWRAPFEKVEAELGCYAAQAFSHGGTLLACSTVQPMIWDLAKRMKVYGPPAGTPKDGARVAHFSADDKSLFWTTAHEVLRWDFATTGTVTSIYKTTDEIGTVVFSERGSVFLTQRPRHAYKGGHALVVQLASGRTTALPDTYFGALSASGKLAAIEKTTELDVVDAASGAVRWKGAIKPPVSRIAFADDDGAIAFTEQGRVRIVDLPAGKPRVADAPSRFVGWLGDGLAGIDKGGSLAQLKLSDGTWSPADRAAIVPARPKDAPAWATWLADAPGGTMAAEKSERHEMDIKHRELSECEGKLRVWTAAGGAKTFSLACSTSEGDPADPGFEIGGGRVIALANRLATVYDAKTGKRVAAVPVPAPTHPKLPATYWTSAVSADGSLLALLWREPRVPEADVHQIDEPECDHDKLGQCVNDYTLEVWSLGAAPKRLWQERLGVEPSGALAIDHAGKHVLLGLASGTVQVWNVAAHNNHPIELQQFPIMRLSVAPGDGWAFAEDAAGEQRLWRIP